MKSKQWICRQTSVCLTAVVMAMALPFTPALAAERAAAAAVDSQGNMQVPADYLTTYEYLGSWAVAADKAAGSKQMHSVYASPGASAAFRKTGKFPAGAILVKEVVDGETGSMTTGTVTHQGALKGWFVMVKDDDKGKHAGSKLWGDGWGWSWFDAGKTQTTTTVDYKAECKGCHVPAQGTDWIYIQGYPKLKSK